LIPSTCNDDIYVIMYPLLQSMTCTLYYNQWHVPSITINDMYPLLRSMTCTLYYNQWWHIPSMTYTLYYNQWHVPSITINDMYPLLQSMTCTLYYNVFSITQCILYYNVFSITILQCTPCYNHPHYSQWPFINWWPFKINTKILLICYYINL
jgi:hypothetical protein